MSGADHALRLFQAGQGLRSVLIHGPIGSGKSTLVAGFPDLLRVPASIDEDTLLGGTQDLLSDAGDAPCLLERAAGRTLLLEELSSFSTQVLSSILRAAEEGGFRQERHGRNRGFRPVNFRVIGTTCDLDSLPSSVRDRFDISGRTSVPDTAAARVDAVISPIDEKEGPSLLPGATVRRVIATVGAESGVGSLRADLALARAGSAAALLDDAERIDTAHIRMVSDHVFAHRDVVMLPPPPPPEASPPADSPDSPESEQTDARDSDPTPPQQPPGTDREDTGSSPEQPEDDGDRQAGTESPDPSHTPPGSAQLSLQESGLSPVAGSGKRLQGDTRTRRGRIIRQVSRGRATDRRDVSVLGTLLAAARRGGVTPSPGRPRIRVDKEDLRFNQRRAHSPYLILFLVDASGSMAGRSRFAWSREAVFSLLEEAYRKRDRVGLVTFAGEEARVLLAPTRSTELASRQLREVRTGGRTPLGAALTAAGEIFRTALRRDPVQVPYLVCVTDGRINQSLEPGNPPIPEALDLGRRFREEFEARSLVVDSESGVVKVGVSTLLARALGGEYRHLSELSASAAGRTIQAG